MGWTDFTDVTRRYNRPVTAAQRTWVAALIEDAEDELVRLIPTLPARIATGELPLERVKRVVAAPILRLLRNPEGYVSHTTTRGPFTEGATRDRTSVSSEIRFTEQDLATLRPSAPSPARSIPLHLPAWRVP